jgi:hypothetical protein
LEGLDSWRLDSWSD